MTYAMKPARFARGGKPSEPAPHNRQATDLLKNAQVAPVIVDDPYERGAKIVTVRSLRDDILATMHTKGEIDQAGFDAGRLYQKHAELAEIGNVAAIDPGKEAVDGGGWCDVLSNAQTNSVRALGEARRILTPVNDDLVRAVLVDRAAFSRLAPTERARIRLTERFIQALEILAALWGCTNQRVREAQRRAGVPVPRGGT